MTPRLEYDKPNCYSNKVLIGPWVWNRINVEQPLQHFLSQSVYSRDYDAKPPSKVDPAVLWDQKLNSEESNFIPQTKGPEPSYFRNFSTTYDLAFNHFPKCIKGRIPRKLRFRLQEFEPVDDYLPSFGNLTKYGFLNYKKEIWECDAQDPRKNLSSHYRENFIRPELEDYKFHRFAIPLENSSAMNTVNRMCFGLELKGKAILKVPEPCKLRVVPNPEEFNPITWERLPNRNKQLK